MAPTKRPAQPPGTTEPAGDTGSGSGTSADSRASPAIVIAVVIVLVLVVLGAAGAGYLLYRRRAAARPAPRLPPDEDGGAVVEMAVNPVFERGAGGPDTANQTDAAPARARTATTDSAGYAQPDAGQPMVYEMHKPLPGLPTPTAAAGPAVTDEHYSLYDPGGGQSAAIRTATGGLHSAPTHGYLEVNGATTHAASADHRGSLDIDRKTAEALVAAAGVPGGFLLRRRRDGGRDKAAAAQGAVGDHVVSWMPEGGRGEGRKGTGGVRHDVLRADSSSGAWRHVSGSPGSETGTSTGAVSLESAAIALLQGFGVRSPRFLLALQINQDAGTTAVYEVVQREPVYAHTAPGQPGDKDVPMHVVNGISLPVGPYSIYDGGSVVGAAGALAGDPGVYSQVDAGHATYAVAVMDETPYRLLFPNSHANYDAASTGLRPRDGAHGQRELDINGYVLDFQDGGGGSRTANA